MGKFDFLKFSDNKSEPKAKEIEQTHIVSEDAKESSKSVGLMSLYAPQEETVSRKKDVADVLLEMGKIYSEQLQRVRDAQRESSKGDPVEFLLKFKLAEKVDILAARAQLNGKEFIQIQADLIQRNAYEMLDQYYVKSNNVIPLWFEDETLVVGTSEPENIFIIDDIRRHVCCDIKIVVCSPEDIETSIEVMNHKDFDIDLDDIASDIADVEVIHEEDDNSDDLEKMAGESPVIKFVNYLITNAIREGASDIHIEPKERHSKVRYRIDGALFEIMQAPAKMHPAVVSRIKIMSNLDISERRLPQDGKISVIIGGRGIDLRVSILPTSHGEKVVIRILDSKSIMRGLDSSGMGEDILRSFREQIDQPHGILLVTGPTGSGKSTTLYSALGQMDGTSLNISTVEDPVEYDLEFCNQVQVIDKIGMSFSAALRSLLRQDPDIIMIGEIRDGETARIAVQAALTGHMVLSTLHTNDAPSSITRLVNIGVDPYLIAAALNGVLAQRLVRKICDNCKEEYQPPERMKAMLESHGVVEAVYHGKGCDKCRESGYAGRVGLFELLVIDDYFREVINNDASIDHITKAFKESGRKTLFDDGIIKIQKGLTTIEEVLRVTEA